MLRKGLQKRKKIKDWSPPLNDSLKFNVDGSSRGKPGHSGIGGVLRDGNGKSFVSSLIT